MGSSDDEEMEYTNDEETENEDNEEVEPKNVDKPQAGSKTNPPPSSDEEYKGALELLRDLFTGINGQRLQNLLKSKRVKTLIKGHRYEKHFENLIRVYYTNPDSNPNHVK